jgi:hypothetical protein
MKYRVIGANRDTGARQILEFEAESKAAAERKAMQAGMTVSRVEDITDGYAAHAIEVGQTARRATGMHPVVKLVMLLVVLAVLYYFAWPYVRAAIGR